MHLNVNETPALPWQQDEMNSTCSWHLGCWCPEPHLPSGPDSTKPEAHFASCFPHSFPMCVLVCNGIHMFLIYLHLNHQDVAQRCFCDLQILSVFFFLFEKEGKSYFAKCRLATTNLYNEEICVSAVFFLPSSKFQRGHCQLANTWLPEASTATEWISLHFLWLL